MNLRKKKVWKFNFFTKIKEIRSRSKKKKVWKFNIFKKIKEIFSLKFKEQSAHLVTTQSAQTKLCEV